jgi:hypothetical protein
MVQLLLQLKVVKPAVVMSGVLPELVQATMAVRVDQVLALVQLVSVRLQQAVVLQ